MYIQIAVTDLWPRIKVFYCCIGCPLSHIINISIISWGQAFVKEGSFSINLTELGCNSFIKLATMLLQIHIIHILQH